MENTIIKQNLSIITDPLRMRSVFEGAHLFEGGTKVADLSIEILKKYEDDESYSATIIYNIILIDKDGLSLSKKILGSASS
ncbi:MAG: hypothetical protein COV30_02405 [Candidatus Yanofskybacteria bacterium CG10_big_fil_rev_8_21_14_0_10_37_15]|uniref:Uncharacterized protein n=1 Tax=Candidatus Yanofskybacteria bacterium CG10_big_fil_rev_8_21_14_0_10_37_15 TaxID=1975097 RepID=A0A2H0R5B6_9BACT|nr:MAG: hypothetical protein COV30_02405 [Candidatus Yanofskybacteria bacterium CG10_big_fil_rev_8_21_14_0_10_37_15]